MQLADYYPTGTDYTVFISDPIMDTSAVLPDFTELEELDASSFTLQEDGNVVPLYDIARRTPDHFAYSRRVINGTLSMNYSEPFAKRFRSPLQTIRGKTLWIRLAYADWKPLRLVRDTFRIPAVYEHTFQHNPMPTATEEIPFSGRDLTLIERETADLAQDVFADFAREQDQATIEASDLFRERKSRHLATVQEVVDGDTIVATIDATQSRPITIRLAGVDTPETSGKRKGNPTQERNADYRWPSNAPSSDRGTPGRAPTKTQMDAWGEFVKDQVREWLPEGKKVWLVTDQGTAPRGSFDRYVFRVDVPGGLPGANTAGGSTNLGQHLIKMGYAVPYKSDSIYLGGGNRYQNMSEVTDNLLDVARDRAGTEDANGIWYSFDTSKWKDHADL